MDCWIENMDRFVRKDSDGAKQLPLQTEKEFYDYLFRFIVEDLEGIAAFRALRVAFLPVDPTEEYPYSRRLQYCVIAALSIGDSRDPRELKNPIFEAWQEDLRDFEATAPKGL